MDERVKTLLYVIYQGVPADKKAAYAAEVKDPTSDLRVKANAMETLYRVIDHTDDLRIVDISTTQINDYVAEIKREWGVAQ